MYQIFCLYFQHIAEIFQGDISFEESILLFFLNKKVKHFRNITNMFLIFFDRSQSKTNRLQFKLPK